MFRSSLQAGLRLELERRPQIFAAAAGRQSALAAFPDIFSVLDVLADPSPESYPAKEELVRAILKELRNEPTFWSAALLLALHPMLCTLRRRMRRSGCTPEDLDSIVEEAFIEALQMLAAQVRADERTFLLLRKATTAQVRRQVASHQRDIARAESRDPSDLPETYQSPFVGGTGNADLSEEDLAEVRVLFARLAGTKVEASKLELVFETRVKGRSLWSLVDERFPGASAEERRRHYQKLKRERSRTIGRLGSLRAKLQAARDGLKASGGQHG